MDSTTILTSENITLGLSALIVSVLTYRWFANRTRRSQFAKLPGPPTNWPLIGNIDLLLKKGVPVNEAALMTFDELSNEFAEEGIFKLDMGPLGVNVYLFRAETVEVILKSSAYIRKSTMYDVFKPWLGDSLVMSDGDKWRHDRKFLTPMFNFKILENMTPLINQHSRVLVDILERTRSVDDVMLRTSAFAFDVIGELLFGVNQGIQLNSENRYHQAFGSTLMLFCKRFLNPILISSDFLYSLTSDGKVQAAQIEEMKAFTEAIVIKRRNELIEIVKESGNFGDDSKFITMIDLLLKSQLQDPSSMTLKELREQLDTFLIAGHETGAVSTAFGLMAIANHPGVQDRIHKELDLVFGNDKDRDVNSEDLKKLDYLDCVVKEILRIWAPVPLISRQLIEDVQIKNYVVPKGTDVWIYLRGLHNDSKQFKKPELFNPDRFLPENAANHHAFAHLPFAGGPRNCIGYKLALIEFKVMYANIFRSLRVNPITKIEDVVCTMETSLKSKEPLAVEFVKRT